MSTHVHLPTCRHGYPMDIYANQCKHAHVHS